MSETSILIAAVIAAGLIGYALGRSRAGEAPRTEGRLTLGTQPITSTTPLAIASTSTSAEVADDVESALNAAENSAFDLLRPGIHMSVKMNVKRIFKLSSKEEADAVAERERAKGMTVVVMAPDATDRSWRVESSKVSGQASQ